MASIELQGKILVLTDGEEVSYADLSELKGDKGCRGAQGRAGVILDSQGNIITEGFATEEYVDSALEGFSVDMTGVATESYVNMVASTKANKEHEHTQYVTEQKLNEYALKEHEHGQYLTEHQSLEGYATETYVNETINNMGTANRVGVSGTGYNSVIFGDYEENKASGNCSFASGINTTASGNASVAEGMWTEASGECAHAEGWGSIAKGYYSHVTGVETVSETRNMNVSGKYNDYELGEGNKTTLGKYSHVVGNGTSDENRSNSHTLDWEGNAWFAGGIILNSPNGTRWMIKVTDTGTLSITESEV